MEEYNDILPIHLNLAHCALVCWLSQSRCCGRAPDFLFELRNPGEKAAAKIYWQEQIQKIL